MTPPLTSIIQTGARTATGKVSSRQLEIKMVTGKGWGVLEEIGTVEIVGK